MQTDIPVSTVQRSRRFSFDTASSWAVALALALAAIAFIPSASVPFLATKVSLLALGGLVALVCFILARLTRGSVIVPPLALVSAFWLLPLAYGLSALFSGAGFTNSLFGTELETDTFGFMLILASLATMSALVFRRSAHYVSFLRVGAVAVIIVLVAQIGFLIASLAAPTSVSASANLVGSFADLGMVAGMAAIFSLLSLRFLVLTRRVRIGAYVVGIVSLIALAIVNSGVIWMLVGLVALGLFIESIMRRRQTVDDDLDGVETLSAEVGPVSDSGRLLAEPLIVLVAALFFLVGGSTLGSALQSSLGINVLDVRPSWQATFAIGSQVYQHAPLFGSGPNTFVTEWLKFRDASLNDTIFWNVDFTSGIGLIPTSFVTVGIVGVIAWLGFLALFLFLGLRALMFRTSADPFIRFVSISSFLGTLYVLVLMIFTVPGPVVLAAGFILAGIFASTLRYSSGNHELGIAFSRSPRVGFVIVFLLTLLLLGSVLAAYSLVGRYLADTSYLKGVNALSTNNIDGAASGASRSILFAPSARAYRLAATVGIAHMNQVAADTTASQDDARTKFQAALSSSVSNALAATKLAPNDYQNWTLLGNVYATVVPLNIDGAYDNAKTAYQRAIALNPTSPALEYALAQLEIAHKNGPAAEAALGAAINLKHDYTQAIFLLSQLEVQEGKATAALQAAEAAAYFAPNDEAVLFQVGLLRSGTGDQPGAIAALSKAVQIDPQYANARFFLAVAYATLGQNDQALAQLQAISALSAANAQAVAADIASLQAGKNPFPASKLGALGVPGTPISQTANGAAATTPASPTGAASSTPAAGAK
jgi:cytochrome c-type biogenesis protein CcmH/NrfG